MSLFVSPAKPVGRTWLSLLLTLLGLVLTAAMVVLGERVADMLNVLAGT